MLLLAAISCMMVANPGTPDSKKKKKKTEKTETVDSVGDSVFVDSLGNEIKSKLKQAELNFLLHYSCSFSLYSMYELNSKVQN